MRLNPYHSAQPQMKLWMETTQNLAPAIEPGLAHLVKIRASQINGCANCLRMHHEEARKSGERQERLDVLSAWRDAPYFTGRERAALAWTEALTQLASQRVTEDDYAELAFEFRDEEQVQLTLLINAINGWNRIAVGFHLFWEGKPGMVREAA